MNLSCPRCGARVKLDHDAGQTWATCPVCKAEWDHEGVEIRSDQRDAALPVVVTPYVPGTWIRWVFRDKLSREFPMRGFVLDDWGGEALVVWRVYDDDDASPPVKWTVLRKSIVSKGNSL